MESSLVCVSRNQSESKKLVAHAQDSGDGALPETKGYVQTALKNNARDVPDAQHMKRLSPSGF